MSFPSLLPQLSRSCILLALLFQQINTGLTRQVSKYQSVNQFSAGSNATLLVKGGHCERVQACAVGQTKE